jgi:alpha-L-rhamnosidase
VGFKKIIMKPVLPDGLDSVSATYKSIHGPISSSWKNTATQLVWKISIPANTTATVYIPANNADDITESGQQLSTIPGIKILRTEKGAVVVEIGSGNYSFVHHKKFKKGIVGEAFIFERASFPESHAATIVETPDGLTAAWFGGTKEGNKDVCIYTSHYRNQQWTAPVKVADGIMNDSLRYPCYNPVLYYATNGELLLFYKIGPNVAGWKGYMKRSMDKGLTWGEREALPDGFLGPIKNKPVLINNELVCASSTEKNGWKVHFEITPDNGRTWRKTESINDGKTITAIQPSILTYADGKLQVLCRSKNRNIMQSWSLDTGRSWQAMSPTTLPNNNSGTDAVTLKDGRQVLLYNHVKPDVSLPNGKGARTPLNMAVSKDGIQWSAALVVEDSPISQYSYPAVIETKDGMLHIVYTWRREKIKHVVVDPSKLQLQPIINEQWPGSIAQKLNASNDE